MASLYSQHRDNIIAYFCNHQWLRQDQVVIITNRQLQAIFKIYYHIQPIFHQRMIIEQFTNLSNLVYIYQSKQNLFLYVKNIKKNMSQNPLVLQLLTYLSNQKQLKPKNLIMLTRYQYQKYAQSIIDFLCLTIRGAHINSRKAVHYQRITSLIQHLLSSADIFITVLLATKIFPGISKKYTSDLHSQIVKKGFEDLLKANPSDLKEPRLRNKMLAQIKQDIRMIISWTEETKYFEFYFVALNNSPHSCRQDINSFQLQTISTQEDVFSKEDLKSLGRQILTECQKLTKKAYKQQIIETLFNWITQQNKNLFIDQKNKEQRIQSLQVLSKIPALNNRVISSTFVRVINKTCDILTISSIDSFLTLSDELMLSGSSQAVLQALITLVPSIFRKILRKQLKVQYPQIVFHFQLWKLSIEKRSFSSILLLYLIEWLALIYDHKNVKKDNLNQKFQLYRGQLQKLVKQSRLSSIKHQFQQMQLKQIELLYEEMSPYHEIMISQYERNQEQLEIVSQNQKTEIKFQFDISKASERRQQIRSMMESLMSQKSDQQAIGVKIQERLQIFSKRHSLNKNLDSSISMKQNISAIVRFLNIFESASSSFSALYSKILPYNSDNSGASFENINSLPIISTYSPINILEEESIYENDKYGLKNRLNLKTKQYNSINFFPIKTALKKQISKNRGLIVKNSCIQLGFMIDSLYFRRRLNIFITFLKPIFKITVRIKQNSIKFSKNMQIQYQMPKVNKQFKSVIDIQKIKLYKDKDNSNISRFVKPKIQIFIFQNKLQEYKEIYTYDLQLHLINLVQWLKIEDNQMRLFEQSPEIASPWVPACSKIRKCKQQDLSYYFSLKRKDEKGNICLKFHFLLELVLAKLYFVQKQVRVVLINSNSEVIMTALLQMVCSLEDQK